MERTVPRLARPHADAGRRSRVWHPWVTGPLHRISRRLGRCPPRILIPHVFWTNQVSDPWVRLHLILCASEQLSDRFVEVSSHEVDNFYLYIYHYTTVWCPWALMGDNFMTWHMTYASWKNAVTEMCVSVNGPKQPIVSIFFPIGYWFSVAYATTCYRWHQISQHHVQTYHIFTDILYLCQTSVLLSSQFLHPEDEGFALCTTTTTHSRQSSHNRKNNLRSVYKPFLWYSFLTFHLLMSKFCTIHFCKPFASFSCCFFDYKRRLLPGFCGYLLICEKQIRNGHIIHAITIVQWAFHRVHVHCISTWLQISGRMKD